MKLILKFLLALGLQAYVLMGVEGAYNFGTSRPSRAPTMPTMNPAVPATLAPNTKTTLTFPTPSPTAPTPGGTKLVEDTPTPTIVAIQSGNVRYCSVDAECEGRLVCFNPNVTAWVKISVDSTKGFCDCARSTAGEGLRCERGGAMIFDLACLVVLLLLSIVCLFLYAKTFYDASRLMTFGKAIRQFLLSMLFVALFALAWFILDFMCYFTEDVTFWNGHKYCVYIKAQVAMGCLTAIFYILAIANMIQVWFRLSYGGEYMVETYGTVSHYMIPVIIVLVVLFILATNLSFWFMFIVFVLQICLIFVIIIFIAKAKANLPDEEHMESPLHTHWTGESRAQLDDVSSKAPCVLFMYILIAAFGIAGFALLIPTYSFEYEYSAWGRPSLYLMRMMQALLFIVAFVLFTGFQLQIVAIKERKDRHDNSNTKDSKEDRRRQTVVSTRVPSEHYPEDQEDGTQDIHVISVDNYEREPPPAPPQESYREPPPDIPQESKREPPPAPPEENPIFRQLIRPSEPAQILVVKQDDDDDLDEPDYNDSRYVSAPPPAARSSHIPSHTEQFEEKAEEPSPTN